MPSLETGEGCFELHYDYSRAENYSIPSLINSFFRAYSLPHTDLIPVITSVKQLSPDKVEIRRKMLYKSFHNSSESTPEEVIVVNRANLKQPGAVVMQSLTTYPGLKQEALKVFSVGYTVQRCLLDRDKCKVFTNSRRM